MFSPKNEEKINHKKRLILDKLRGLIVVCGLILICRASDNYNNNYYFIRYRGVALDFVVLKLYFT